MDKLALHGGDKSHAGPWPAWPICEERDVERVVEVTRSGKWGVGGEVVPEFEKRFAEWVGVEHCTCVTSGTTALEVALLAVGVGPGDEVIVPPYTFLATASSVLYAGAVPVFVDIDADTFCIDPARIEEAVTDKTKAIIPVHMGGNPCDMDAVNEIAQKHALSVIEDCAQAHGAEWKRRRVGGLGHVGAFSFQVSKNIPGGEGGALCTDDRELAERIWSIHNCGRVPDGAWYQHNILGWNLRMTQFQAAVLLGGLERVDEHMKLRDANGAHLSRRLAQIEGLTPAQNTPGATRNAYHLFMSRYDAARFDGLPRGAFVEAMRAEGVPLSTGYSPLYKSPAIVEASPADYSDVDCPACESICDEGLWLSQSILLASQSDMDDIADAALKVQRNVSALLAAAPTGE
ncbi:MAG: DegT/DnrJ/EryC1/StrS family aminotransferase [Armatimonadota bacterium]|jgi:dTDP-4-amino-4,6-dideoxygalactose transaminase